MFSTCPDVWALKLRVFKTYFGSCILIENCEQGCVCHIDCDFK